MPNYRTQQIFYDAEHRQAVISVHSHLCFYRVAIAKEVVTVIGPGVEEEYEIGKEIPRNTSPASQALIAVILFEDGE